MQSFLFATIEKNVCIILLYLVVIHLLYAFVIEEVPLHTVLRVGCVMAMVYLPVVPDKCVEFESLDWSSWRFVWVRGTLIYQLLLCMFDIAWHWSMICHILLHIYFKRNVNRSFYFLFSTILFNFESVQHKNQDIWSLINRYSFICFSLFLTLGAIPGDIPMKFLIRPKSIQTFL